MDVSVVKPRESASAFLAGLQSHGRYTFSDADAVMGLSRSAGAVQAVLRRLRSSGRIVALRRGFYVIVPPEYGSAGSPPASWFIDDLMRYLQQPYYVGLLTAAALYGASHQQPMVFQVVTDRPTRPAMAGRTAVEFHMSRLAERTPADAVQTETGFMRVSTPAATAFDLVRFARACGGWGNVATVLQELAERLDPEALYAGAASVGTPQLQRLGYLLDRAGHPRLADPLLRVLSAKRYRPVLLAPDAPRGEEEAASPWRVIPNEDVEVDL